MNLKSHNIELKINIEHRMRNNDSVYNEKIWMYSYYIDLDYDIKTNNTLLKPFTK